MVPAIKVYKMDYSFIIKNYLNPELWKKTWTLFEYKDYVITLNLYRIDIYDNSIVFKLKFKDNSNQDAWKNFTVDFVSFNLSAGKIEFLIKSINSMIFRLIQEYEKYVLVSRTDEYDNLMCVLDQEEDNLTSYANAFLNANNVTNSEIRAVYISDYIYQNSKKEELESNLRDTFQYHLVPDLYLVYLKSIDNSKKYEEVLNALEENEIASVLSEINKYQQIIESESYEEEMTGLLESL